MFGECGAGEGGFAGETLGVLSWVDSLDVGGFVVVKRLWLLKSETLGSVERSA